MTRLHPTQTKLNQKYLLLSFLGQFILIMGFNGLIRPLLRPDSPESFGPLWFLAILAAAGTAIMVYGYRKAQENPFFIEWDNDTITWFLPGQKGTKTLHIRDIRDITLKHFTVDITQKDNQTASLNLENFLYKDLQKAKKAMEEIKEKKLLQEQTYN